MKNNSYIGITAVLLVFGIWAVPKIIDYISGPDLAIIGDKVVPEFSFIDQHGETITNGDYQGKVWIAEFFFTTCPDICPIMNRNMIKVQDAFFADSNLGIASFTIDPMYDTPEILKKYAESYKITKPQWHLLTGDKDKIFQLANAGFNLYVGEIPDSKGGFEHSGYFALIDKNGNIRSRRDKNDNPIIYYDGLDDANIKMLIEDIKKVIIAMSNSASENTKKYSLWIWILSIAIPVAVAALFTIKIPGVERLGFLPPIYASINALTALLLVLAVIQIKKEIEKPMND